MNHSSPQLRGGSAKGAVSGRVYILIAEPVRATGRPGPDNQPFTERGERLVEVLDVEVELVREPIETILFAAGSWQNIPY
jgi:hypothetical protein